MDASGLAVEPRGIHRRTPIIVTPSLRALLNSHVLWKGDGCWTWCGCLRSGYPCLKINGQLLSAHRVSFSIYRGPIPDGHIVCHACDNKVYTNPEHLFSGPPIENVRDMHRKGRSNFARGERVGCAKLTASIVADIRRLAALGEMSLRALGRQFGVTGTTIEHCVSRKTWAHVE